MPVCCYFVITNTGVDLFRRNIWALGVFVDKDSFFFPCNETHLRHPRLGSFPARDVGIKKAPKSLYLINIHVTLFV